MIFFFHFIKWKEKSPIQASHLLKTFLGKKTTIPHQSNLPKIDKKKKTCLLKDVLFHLKREFKTLLHHSLAIHAPHHRDSKNTQYQVD